MQRKWLILLVGVIVVVVGVIGVGAYFSLVSSFTPPVDTSGINISSALTTEEVLPAQLIGKPLKEVTESITVHGFTSGVEYFVFLRSAHYDGTKINVIKAETEAGATVVFENYFILDLFDYNFTGWRRKSITSSWFTWEGGGISGFFWKSDIWVFGVEAEDAEARNQAAAEWVQELKGY